ncbi:MAG: metalloregulator ArsR/SmtB family transcription factor [Nitrospirota bacterium]
MEREKKEMDKKLYELHAEICKIFANPKRLEILNALREGELTVSDLVEILGTSKANVSQHLALLRGKGILRTRREGLNIYYSVANPKVIQACILMREVLIEQLNEGHRLAKHLAANVSD